MRVVGEWYVYELRDPRNGKPFYIGKGSGNRVSEHVRDFKAGRVRNQQKTKRIAEILAEGLSVEEVVLETFSVEDDAFAHEASLIEKIGLDNLTNLVAGGGGGSSADGVAVKTLITKARDTERDWFDLISRQLNFEKLARRYGYAITPIASTHGELQMALRMVGAMFMLASRYAARELEAMPEGSRVPVDLLDALIQKHVDSIEAGRDGRKETGSGSAEGSEEQEDSRAA